MATQKDIAAYLFHEGTNYNAHDYMGVHRESGGYVFRVWAPNADRVFLVGDFNEWSEDIPLHKVTLGGVWETAVFSKKISVGDKYKFKIYNGARVLYKADPYARVAGAPPETASLISMTIGMSGETAAGLIFAKALVASTQSFR